MIHFNRILCPIDFSEYSDHALRYAMMLAARYRASVDVLHVMPPITSAAAGGFGGVGRFLIERDLTATVERSRQPDVAVATELLESSHVPETIARRADDLEVDLIVTGSHGRTGLQRLLLGSVVEPLLHRCHQPVLVVPAHLDIAVLHEPMTLRRVVCAVDFSPASLAAVTYAMTIAEEAGAKLTLVNVIEPEELLLARYPDDPDGERARCEAETERLTKLQALVPWIVRQFCAVESEVVAGRAAREILRVADRQRADLIVLGGHGRNLVDLTMFGSNAHAVITRAQSPVLIVPAVRRAAAVRLPVTAHYAEPALAV